MHVLKLQSPVMVVALAAALSTLLAACSKPAEKTEEVRPVRAIVLAASDIDVDASFSGEVRARYESQLGFRVPGKIVSRKVDVGTVVKKGQALMQLDPQDLRLGQAQALAQLRAAETTRDLAQADLKRYQGLRAENFVSPSVLESKDSAYQAAVASADAARAAYRNQANQAGYASLVSDVDGVVTAVDAEAGQVVAAGTPVVRVARTDEKEVVFGVPEDKVDQLRQVADVKVKLWSEQGSAVPAKIREVSPIADPATRTYAFKATLPATLTQAKLGMTAVVQFESKLAQQKIKVPLTALFHDRNATSVWVVDKGAVRLVPVTVTAADGNELVLGSGVQPGQTVVTAGVHLLKNGQKVRILGDDLPASAPKPAGAVPPTRGTAQ